MSNPFVTLKVWLPGSHPGTDPESLTLENPSALQFFLESLYLGNSIFGTAIFEVRAYRGTSPLGRGSYRIRFARPSESDYEEEPVHLVIVEASGELMGILDAAWREMLDQMRRRRTQIVPSRHQMILNDPAIWALLADLGLTITPHSDPSSGWVYKWRGRGWEGAFESRAEALTEAFGEAQRALRSREYYG